jgi:hypothetical protein
MSSGIASASTRPFWSERLARSAPRLLLVERLSRDPEFEIRGVAAPAVEAVRAAQATRPDVSFERSNWRGRTQWSRLAGAAALGTSV